MHTWLLAIAAALALTAPATSALPLPAGGQFAVAGGPAFIAGAWLQISPATEAGTTLIEANQIGSWTLGPAPGANFTGVYLVIESFQCLGPSTAVIAVKGIRAMQNTTVTSCSVAYANATHLVMRWLLDPGADDVPETCPEDPFTDAPGTVGAVYERVEGVVPTPEPLACANTTSTPAGLLGAEVMLPGAHNPVPPPRTPYPQPGGPPVVNGIWKIQGSVQLVSSAGYGALAFQPPWDLPKPPPKQALSMYAGRYVDHECLGPAKYRAFSWEVDFYINGTDPYTYTCEVGSRETLANGTTVIHLAMPKQGGNVTDCPPDLFDSPDADKFTLTLVEDLPWKPSIACTGGGTSPSPKPSPAPPSGGAAARLAALPAVLLFLLV